MATACSLVREHGAGDQTINGDIVDCDRSRPHPFRSFDGASYTPVFGRRPLQS